MAPDGLPESGSIGPLSGRRVVVTRSIADNRGLADKLDGLGAEVMQVPTVEVLAPADGGSALRSAVERLEQYRYVVLTSTNGVDAMAAAMADRPWPGSVSVVPVGPVTERAAIEAGMVVGSPPSEATAACLVAEFEPWIEGQTCAVLAPLAELASDVVVKGLEAKGYAVDRVEAYRTAAPPPSARSAHAAEGQTFGPVDAILFFSPSAVDRFLTRAEGQPGLPITDDCVVICVGPATAARAAARAMHNIVVADPHTEIGVVDALVSTLQ